jgi:hypothetical protein
LSKQVPGFLPQLEVECAYRLSSYPGAPLPGGAALGFISEDILANLLVDFEFGQIFGVKVLPLYPSTPYHLKKSPVLLTGLEV